MTPEQLRELKDCYDEICTLKQKMNNVLKALNKTGILDESLKLKIGNARSIEELEYVVSLFN